MGQRQLMKPSHGQTHAILIYKGGSYDFQRLAYTYSIDENIGASMIRVPANNIYSVFLTLNLFKTIIDKFR